MNSVAPATSIFATEGLLQVLLDVSLTGLHIFSPIYGLGAEVEDFAIEYLNPAAQRMLGLPERPGGTVRTRFPDAESTGILAFYRRVFETGEAGRFDVNYQADGLDNYYRLAAQRAAQQLIVSFTDTADHNRTAVEIALRDSQTREKAALLQVEQERNLFQAVLKQAPVGIGLMQGDDLVVTMANDQLCAMWGYAPAQVMGRPLLEGVPELCGQGFEKLLAEVARTRTPFIGTEVPAQLLRDGQLATHYFNFVYQPMFGPAGDVLGVLDLAIDVTVQVLANQQVQQLNSELETRVVERTQAVLASQAKAELQRSCLERLFMAAPAAICILSGPTLVFDLANPTYQQQFPGRVLLGQSLLVAIPEMVGSTTHKLLRQVYETGVMHQDDNQCILIARPEDGMLENRYFNVVYKARRDEHGRIDGLVLFGFEVTKQVRAQQRREVQQQQLHELFEQAPVAIAVFRGPQYVIEVANPAVCTLWGRSPAQALGTPLFELLPEAVGQGFETLLDKVLATGVPYVAKEMAVVLHRDGHDQTVHMNFVYQPLRDADGRISGITVVATDVTEQVGTRQQLAATIVDVSVANQRLTRANTDLANFIYTASHDLKTPISNIEGLVHVLREQLPVGPGRDELVQTVLAMMQRAVERFQLTITQLTDISRLQYANAQIAETLDLAALVEHVSLDLAVLRATTQAEIIVDVAACPTVIFVSKNMRSIVYNLLSNGIKYHAPNRTPLVQLRAYRTTAASVLEVQDNGLGLRPNQQSRLFGMFQRLHDHVDGSGIGLYMVKKIVTNAGGTITVRSEVGVGSTFIVTLPDLVVRH